MGPQAKRTVTAGEKTRLGKANISDLLSQPEAWDDLTLETRQHLYSFLPPPRPELGEEPYDPDVNPLLSIHGMVVKEELEKWQQDVNDGLETKKWRQAAMLAGQDRMTGKFDEWKEANREEYWGQAAEVDEEEKESGEPKASGESVKDADEGIKVIAAKEVLEGENEEKAEQNGEEVSE